MAKASCALLKRRELGTIMTLSTSEKIPQFPCPFGTLVGTEDNNLFFLSSGKLGHVFTSSMTRKINFP